MDVTHAVTAPAPPAPGLIVHDPVSIPIQPVPIDASLIVTRDRKHSSLARHWRQGEARLCRLCPIGLCVANGDFCHMVIPGEIPSGQALMWSTAGLPRAVGLPGNN